MLRIFSIFALSMFLSCQEETISRVGQCGRMTFSDALPVQFWRQECETFNEHEAQGVFHVCWCAPWNCDDEIVVQFLDPSNTLSPVLILKSDDGSIKSALSFNSPVAVGSQYYYTTSFTPQGNGICNEYIQLLIFSNSDVIYSGSVSEWVDLAGSWAYKDNNRFTNNDSGSDSSYLVLSPVLTEGNTISFPVTFEVVAISSGEARLDVNLLDSSGSAIPGLSSLLFIRTSAGVDTHNISFTVPDGYTAGRLQVSITNTSGGTTASAYLFSNEEISVPPLVALAVNLDDTLGKSDCLDVQTSHDETVLFNYSNHRNFDGLIYPDISPDISFNLRIPCRFFHEVEVEEDEAMELTSSILTTSAQVKTQRLLEVKHAPYYFHKKLRRVLKHQVLSAIGKAWKKEEKYEVNEGRKTWPLKSATCLLTEKNSVVRNVL